MDKAVFTNHLGNLTLSEVGSSLELGVMKGTCIIASVWTNFQFPGRSKNNV